MTTPSNADAPPRSAEAKAEKSDTAAFWGPVLHLVRVTLEVVSPLSLGDAEGGGLLDVHLARDANGLPAIPGASLAGVLRHLWQQTWERDGGPAADDVFGFIEPRTDKGAPARLTVGFGCVHDRGGKAVTGLLLADDAKKLEDDPILRALCDPAPLLREHVRLTGRGVPDDRGKFERAAAPRGTRFSLEMSLWGTTEERESDTETLAKLAGLFEHPAFRIGGAARRGYGKVQVVSLRAQTFDLSKGEGLAEDGERELELRRVRRQPPSMTDEFAMLKPATPTRIDTATATLTLKPKGYWRVGDGARSFLEDNRGGHSEEEADGRREADLVPLTEPWIEWKDGQAIWRDAAEIDWKTDEERRRFPLRFVIPGSSLKGAIAHRTLFHYNRLVKGRMLEGELSVPLAEDRMAELKKRLCELSKPPSELEALFGAPKRSARDKNAQRQDRGGRAARLIVDDVIVKATLPASSGDAASGPTDGREPSTGEEKRGEPAKIGALDHVALDRFTQAPMTGALYAEECVWGGTWEVKVTVLPPLPEKEGERARDLAGHEPKVRQALALALRDLCEGRLAIGAKSHGLAEGDIAWASGGEHFELPTEESPQ